LLLAALMSGGCAGRVPPAAQTITGDGFEHRVRVNGELRAAPLVHVYLEGDGRPFRTRHHPASDPSPRRALALELMMLDPTPSLYLGRPCYDGLAQAPACHTALWTSARYSETVIASMSAALAALRSRYGFRAVTLIGYSGGGVLASLIAERLPAVNGLVTLAANLDIEAWARLHAYTPLSMSLNPAARAALPPGIAQWHYVGSADRNVPPAQISAALAHQPFARLRVLAGVGHVEGWVDAWPGLLLEFGGSIPAGALRRTRARRSEREPNADFDRVGRQVGVAEQGLKRHERGIAIVEDEAR